MGAAATYRRSTRVEQRVYSLPAPLTQASYMLAAPGLARVTVATVCLKVSKPTAFESLAMLFSIPDPGGAFTDLCYAGRAYSPPRGLGQNTYTNGFWTADDRTLLDNAAVVLVSAKFYQGQQNSRFDLYVNGAKVVTTNTGDHANRLFTDSCIFGATTNDYLWPGTIYAGKLLLYDATDAQRLAVEAAL